MAKGDKSAVPATPMKSSGGRTEGSSRSGSSFATPSTSGMRSVAEHSNKLDESEDFSDAKEEDDHDYPEAKTAMSEFSEAAVVSAGRSGGVRAFARNLTEELDDVAGPEPAHDDHDDGSDEMKSSVMAGKGTSRQTGSRPPLNGDTPAANRVLGRCLELMNTKIEWMQLFKPETVRQAVWMDLGGELALPINSTSVHQVAQDTVLLLRAMGCEPQTYPSDVSLKDWRAADAGSALRKWKKKLRSAFGTTDISAGRQPIARRAAEVDPATVPLPATPQRATEDSKKGAFAAAGGASPYWEDSHMVTPRSESRAERLAEEANTSFKTPNTRRDPGRSKKRLDLCDESSSDSDDDVRDIDNLDGDLAEEWTRQVRELSEQEGRGSTPRIEVTTHLPLANITPYAGLRDKSEKSMQWLRAFMYGMKGTHTPPNDWFELSLRDGTLHWYRQLPRKTKRNWKLLSAAFIKYYCSQFSQSAQARYYSAKRGNNEHVCDYLNGYARNAGVQFEGGGRDTKDHVKHFLDTCDGRGLEERLCHVRVKHIHDLEDMINDIMRSRERKTTREPSVRRSRGQDDGRRREPRRTEDSRDHYRRERHDRDDPNRRARREESPYRPRITLADALSDMVAALGVKSSEGARPSYSDAAQLRATTTEVSDDEGGYCSDDGRPGDNSENEYGSDKDYGHVDAANENERRAAVNGTFARTDNRRPRGDNTRYQSDRERQGGRGDREGRRQYGPCAACGGLTHSAHYCYRRCKLCKQVHDAGKCEAFQELATLLRSKVDKKDLSPELQSLVYGASLN